MRVLLALTASVVVWVGWYDLLSYDICISFRLGLDNGNHIALAYLFEILVALFLFFLTGTFVAVSGVYISEEPHILPASRVMNNGSTKPDPLADVSKTGDKDGIVYASLAAVSVATELLEETVQETVTTSASGTMLTKNEMNYRLNRVNSKLVPTLT